MHVLVTGGNKWLQHSAVTALGEAGHQVRLLSEAGADTTQQWPAHVEPWYADRRSRAQIVAAASSCEIVVALEPLQEPAAWRSALRRGRPRKLIVLSSSAAGTDHIHDVSRIAADLTADWLLLECAPIYGIGDDPVTQFLGMMRTLPVVPLLNSRHQFRPLWHRDVSEAIVAAIDLPASSWKRVLALAGPDTTTYQDLYDRLSLLIDRRPWRLPVPDALATERVRETLQMTTSDEPMATDATLAVVLRVQPTPLPTGLQLLVDGPVERGPWEGVGDLEQKLFSASIAGGRCNAIELMHAFRQSFKDVMPIPVGVEPAASNVQLVEGETVTMELPGRGHVQVRIIQASDTQTTLATLRGHVVAGVVQFTSSTRGSDVRFEVMTCDTPGHWVDWLALRLGGTRLQDANWRRVLTNVATLADGELRDVDIQQRTLHGEDAEHMEQWIGAMIDRHRARQPRMEREPDLAVVTGASSGIGLELARCCAEAGFELLLVADDSTLNDVARELREKSARVSTVVTDLHTAEGRSRVRQALGDRVPTLLIANAGVALGHAFLDQPFDRVRRVIETNITGTIDLVQQIGRAMLARRSGRLLITSSISASIPGPFDAVYNGSKAFLTSFAAALRNELSGTGVLVTCLEPGPADTPIFERSGLADTVVGQQKKDDPRDVAAAAFAALMRGEGEVVPGWKAYLQKTVAQVTPASVLAELHRQAAQPRSP